MSVRSFRSISMVAGVATAALGCYMISLRVAAERATLAGVETDIVLAQRDIRSLQTEIGTRGRLEQLEKWNAKVLALSAPAADQFLQGSFQLATLVRPRDKVVDPSAPVVLAAAPAPQRNAPVDQSDGANARPGETPAQMMHVASYRTQPATAAEAGGVSGTAVAQKSPAPKKAVEKPAAKGAPAAKPVAQAVTSKAVAKAAADKPAHAAAKKVATADPLAPTSVARPVTVKDSKAKK